MKNNKVLGKGLSALISENIINERTNQSNEAVNLMVDINLVDINRYQPRKIFNDADLNELTDSIKAKGVISPIIVRQKNDNRYEIIAGERRYRASKLAGLSQIPIVIKEATDRESLELALIENIQRADLTIIEEAEGYQRLIEEYEYTQEQLAAIIGKSRSHVTNILRLLSLPDSIKYLLNTGQITMGHARALINTTDPDEIAKKILEHSLSVRDTERIIKKMNEVSVNSNKKALEVIKDQDDDIKNIEESLTRALGMKIKIEDTANGGRVIIYFHNIEQLDTILQKLNNGL